VKFSPRSSKPVSAAVLGAVAVSCVAALGTAGTAFAATPAVPAPAAVGSQLQAPHPPPPPPHHFRARFHTIAQCQAAARHDHPNRPADWDCRRGPDRNNPWEYWGR
jgi:hypothetical protein